MFLGNAMRNHCVPEAAARQSTSLERDAPQPIARLLPAVRGAGLLRMSLLREMGLSEPRLHAACKEALPPGQPQLGVQG